LDEPKAASDSGEQRHPSGRSGTSKSARLACGKNPAGAGGAYIFLIPPMRDEMAPQAASPLHLTIK